MRILLSYFVIFALPFFVGKEDPVTPAIDEKSVYCNDQFDYCLEYPSLDLPKKYLPGHCAGFTAKSIDEDIVLTVVGKVNPNLKNSWQLFGEMVEEPMSEMTDSRIVYVIIENEYYETSYIKDDYRYYQKLLRKGDESLLITMSAPEEKYYDLRTIEKNIELDF